MYRLEVHFNDPPVAWGGMNLDNIMVSENSWPDDLLKEIHGIAQSRHNGSLRTSFFANIRFPDVPVILRQKYIESYQHQLSVQGFPPEELFKHGGLVDWHFGKTHGSDDLILTIKLQYNRSINEDLLALLVAKQYPPAR